MIRLWIILLLVPLFYTFAFTQCNGDNPSVDNPTPYSSSLSIEENFNNARAWEETNKYPAGGCSIDNMVAPPGGWAALTDIEKALYIIQDERLVRGLLPLQGMETNLNSVAEANSMWQLNNNRFSHKGDPTFGTTCQLNGANNCLDDFAGSCPWDRINGDPEINSCWEWVSENIGVYSGYSDFIPLSIYNMMYRDKGSLWGHRISFLYTFNNNFGDADHEGFIGIGIFHRNGYVWPFSCNTYNADFITFNLYDPQGTATCVFDPYDTGNICPESLSLSGPIPDGPHYAQEIDATGTVGAVSDVSIQAEISIDLLSGFETLLGGTLHAMISTCPTPIQQPITTELKKQESQMILIGTPLSYKQK